MNQTDYDELKKTVDFMRKEGVISLKMLGLEILLGEASLEVVQEVDIVTEKPNPRPGKDGLSAQEQIDTYGRVIDAEG